MTTKTLEDQIKSIQATAAQAIKEITEAYEREKPVSESPLGLNEGDEYWFPDSCGEVSANYFYDDQNDTERYEMGNMFLTQQEAEHHVDVTKARVRIERKMKELNGDWAADWGDDQQEKYWIIYNHGKLKYQVDWWCTKQPDLLVGTEKSCQWIIDNMQGDLDFVFGVKRV